MLDCIDPNTGGRGNGENLHAFEHGAPEPGEFADNEGIAFAKFAQDSFNPAFAPWDLAGHLFLDELDFDEAVQDLRSPANRIGFPPTRGCRTTPASCPQNLRSGSSRKTGSRQIGNSPTSSAKNEILYGGIGTYVRLGPITVSMPVFCVRAFLGPSENPRYINA